MKRMNDQETTDDDITALAIAMTRRTNERTGKNYQFVNKLQDRKHREMELESSKHVREQTKLVDDDILNDDMTFQNEVNIECSSMKGFIDLKNKEYEKDPIDL